MSGVGLPLLYLLLANEFPRCPLDWSLQAVESLLPYPSFLVPILGWRGMKDSVSLYVSLKLLEWMLDRAILELLTYS